MPDASSVVYASSILKEMIIEFVDQLNTRHTEIEQLNDDNNLDNSSILGFCHPFEDALTRCKGNPNDDIFGSGICCIPETLYVC